MSGEEVSGRDDDPSQEADDVDAIEGCPATETVGYWPGKETPERCRQRCYRSYGNNIVSLSYLDPLHTYRETLNLIFNYIKLL